MTRRIKLSEENIRLLQDCYTAGLSQKAAAFQTCCSAPTVYKYYAMFRDAKRIAVPTSSCPTPNMMPGITKAQLMGRR